MRHGEKRLFDRLKKFLEPGSQKMQSLHQRRARDCQRIYFRRNGYRKKRYLLTEFSECAIFAATTNDSTITKIKTRVFRDELVDGFFRVDSTVAFEGLAMCKF